MALIGKKKSKDNREMKSIKQRKKDNMKQQKLDQRKAKKELKKHKRLQKRYKRENVRENDTEFAPLFGYDYRPSYISVGDRCGTILKIVNKFGTNREQPFGWFIDLIPKIRVDGNIKTYLIEGDQLMDEKQQDNIFKKEVYKVIDGYDPSNDTKVETSGDRRIKDLMIQDFVRASEGESQTESIVDSFIYVLITGDTPYHVSKQLRMLNQNYKDEIHGVEAMSVAGNQENMFTNVLEPPQGSKIDYTWMTDDFAGNDHAVRRGLDDPKGVSVGQLTESYAGGQALMALYDSIDKRALVASYENSSVFQYNNYSQDENGEVDDYNDYSNTTGSSLWGQRIANDAMIHDHRTFHVVMNEFEYGADEFPVEGQPLKFFCPPSVNRQIQRFDLAKGGLNPIEMFGDIEKDKDYISEIYNTNLDKLKQMFHLMSGRSLEKKEITMLEQALNAFYISKGMWRKNAENNPQETRILGLKHDTVPKMGALTAKLAQFVQNNLNEREGGVTEREIDDSRHLEAVMQTNLQKYRAIFNTHTTLPDPESIDKMQIYYDISRLRHDPNMLEAQFLNAFDYILKASERGDIIMFHGADNISIETWEVLKSRINTATRRGVKLVYLFDTIGGSNTKTKVEYANIFNTEGTLYQNLDVDFGFTIIGAMSLNDLRKYQNKVKQKLTNRLKSILTATNSPLQYQIRRPRDVTTVMVKAQFFI